MYPCTPRDAEDRADKANPILPIVAISRTRTSQIQFKKAREEQNSDQPDAML